MATYESNEVQISVYKWLKHKKPSLVIGEKGSGFSVATLFLSDYYLPSEILKLYKKYKRYMKLKKV